MFTKDIKFKYNWRTYQKRVLDDIDKHLIDDKLHIIAPPGSGKTVLGLEVVRRLNKPTLILSPTITIRNQWVDRFTELFANNDYNDYSYRLKEPKYITSSTYQSLHSVQSKVITIDDETDDIILEQQEEAAAESFNLIKTLNDNKIEVIVLDEAHHLKTAWWKSLTQVVQGLGNITIVSLTATPPYDSSAIEWDRYIELCGPIDAEISVPELVKEKSLCPHQDLIYFSNPTPAESSLLDSFYSVVDKIINNILNNIEFDKIISEHPVIISPEEYSEKVFENIEYYASLIVFLNYKNSDKHFKLQKFIGMINKNIPEFSAFWLETLLSNVIFKDSLIADLDIIKDIKKNLKQSGVIERKKVILTKKEGFKKILGSSLSKFKSIKEIVDNEYKNLNKDLRLVILSDYVRKEVLNQKSEVDKFGVIPIFKYLYNSNKESTFNYTDKVAVLSGTITVIPNSIKDEFISVASNYGVLVKDITFEPLSNVEHFSEVVLTSNKKSKMVNIITDLFTLGSINIIIGTKSLLGEGWDCPAINSLIMATFVGSYMFSNQIRGRAIRTDISNPHKTSNIWHLMCFDPINRNNNSDYFLLNQRFKCFIGLDSDNDIITNGIDRLNLPNLHKVKTEHINSIIKDNSNYRDRLYNRWNSAINLHKGGSLIKEIKAKRTVIQRQIIFTKTIKFLIIQSLFTSIFSASKFLEDAIIFMFKSDNISFESLSTIISFTAVIGILSFLPSTIKSLILLFKHGSISSSFKQISLSVLDTMKALDMFELATDVILETEFDKNGTITCKIKNCSVYEQSIFLTAVSDIVGQIKNPRYLITRRQKLITMTLDYHSVPAVFATKKDKAQIFLKYWNKHMGKSTLYYTRNSSGRMELIKARSNSLSASFVKNSEIIDSWKS